jgi:hypothetical protein
MTSQSHASHLPNALKGPMTVLLLSTYVAAAIAVVAALGGSSSAMFASPSGPDTATIELSASAPSSQGFEP